MILDAHGLHAGYGRLPVLFDVDFSVRPGEMVALVGPNGAGKSTLLKTLIGVVKPTKGRVVFDGARVTHEPPHSRVKRGLALSPEGRRVFANLSVGENLRTGIAGTPADVVAAQIEKIHELFPVLGQRRTQLAGSLSGGEQQMLAIGRALISDPKLVMIDELSLGLAPLVVKDLYAALAALASSGVAVVVVDERASEMIEHADRTLVIEKGAIVFEGSHAEAEEWLAESSQVGVPIDRG